jgi:hypothetical protein
MERSYCYWCKYNCLQICETDFLNKIKIKDVDSNECMLPLFLLYLCGRVHLTTDDTYSRPDVQNLDCCLNVGHNTVGLRNVTLNIDITGTSKIFLFSWSVEDYWNDNWQGI